MSRFSVGFWSVLTETDQKLTKNRPKADCLQGVRSDCGVYEGSRSVAEIKVSKLFVSLIVSHFVVEFKPSGPEETD